MMEFVVIAYIREQEQKLRWVRQNQKKLRAETYKTLCENVEAGNEQGKNMTGELFYPSLFMEVLGGISKKIMNLWLL